MRISLELQRDFGLRHEEATKFQPRYADQGDHLRIKGSWTKGGRERVIPITTPEQRATLDKAHKLVGEGSLIPAGKTYIEQRHVYDRQCKLTDLKHMHGLRHAYAQRRYEALTGWKSPAADGPSTRSLTPSQRLADFEARQIISRELGHERVDHQGIPWTIRCWPSSLSLSLTLSTSAPLSTQISLVLPGHQFTARRERNRSRPQGGGLLLSRSQWKQCFHWLAKCVDRFIEDIAVKSAAARSILISPKRFFAAAQEREYRVPRQGTVTLTLPC